MCNWGPGIDRHPARLHAATGGAQRTPAVDLRGVARERLIDSGFWFMLFRTIYVPNATPRGPALLYDGLLPALTDMPGRTTPLKPGTIAGLPACSLLLCGCQCCCCC